MARQQGQALWRRRARPPVAAISPAWLLLLGAIRHQAWDLFDAGALAWNICGSIVVCVLLVKAVWTERSRLSWLIVAWWLYEEFLIILCSAWRMVEWWQVLPGQEQCSARLGVHLGAVSMVIVAWFAAALLARKGEQ